MTGSGAGRLGGGEGCPHFLNVDDRFDDETVCAGIGEGLGQTVEIAGRLVEGKIAQRTDELPGGADIAGDADMRGGCPGIAYCRLCDGFHLIFQPVIGKL